MKQVTKNNKTFNVNDRHETWWNCVVDGTWEQFTYDIIDKFVDENTICIDLGAWIGPITLYLSEKTKEVHSIEPDPQALIDLSANVAANSNKNVFIYNCAISNYNGVITLGNDQTLGNSVTRLNQSKNNFEVNCYTLTSFCESKSIDKVDFIKIDIEGSEEFVLEDIAFFKKYKPTVYVQLHNWWFSDKEKSVQTIKNIASLYKNIYDEAFNKINVDEISNANCIFTDKTL